MPLGRRSHRGRALAGGKADHPTLGDWGQMRRQHDIGMRGGNRGVEDRAQEWASVGHFFTRSQGWKHAMQLIHPIAAKENPRGSCEGFESVPRMLRSMQMLRC